MGVLELRFNRLINEPNLKDINKHNIDIFIKNRTEEDEERSNLTGLTWSATEITPDKLFIQFTFENPLEISSKLERD